MLDLLCVQWESNSLMTSFRRNSPPKVYHGQPTVGGPLSGPRQGRSPVEYRVSYINNLYTDVVIGWRSGFSFSIPSSGAERFGETFVIRVEISLAPWVSIDVGKLLSRIRDDSNVELKAMKEAIEVQSSKSRHGGTLLTVDYPVTMETLKKYGGAVYYSELDQVVSILPAADTPDHPYSDAGKAQYVQDTQGNHASRGFTYNLEIVDNTGRMGTRFVNINGSVFPINPTPAYGRRDGIYVRTSGSIDEFGEPHDTVKRVGSTGDLGELGIFSSFEEATTRGDASHKLKLQETEKEQLLAELKHQVTTQKHRFDLEKIEREQESKANEEIRTQQQAEFARIRERQLHDLELRRLEVKDHYESRSYTRKDSSEVIKTLPTAVMGLSAIVMAVKAFL